jgi:hypothetical protein
VARHASPPFYADTVIGLPVTRQTQSRERGYGSATRQAISFVPEVDFANNGSSGCFDGNADIGVLGDGLVRNTPERAGLSRCQPPKSLIRA